MSAPSAPTMPTQTAERPESSGQWLLRRLHEQRLQADRSRLAALLAAHGTAEGSSEGSAPGE